MRYIVYSNDIQASHTAIVTSLLKMEVEMLAYVDLGCEILIFVPFSVILRLSSN